MYIIIYIYIYIYRSNGINNFKINSFISKFKAINYLKYDYTRPKISSKQTWIYQKYMVKTTMFSDVTKLSSDITNMFASVMEFGSCPVF